MRARGRTLAAALGLAAFAAAWVYVAGRLWHTSVPAHLATPHLKPSAVFPAHALHRAESFEAFLRVTFLLGQAALIGALVYYARKGP